MEPAEDRLGILFVVAAPSGTGKTTVCRRVVADDPKIVFSVSHTTRRRRGGEKDGVDYHFTSVEEFDRMAKDGAFLEWAVYNGNHYGTSWAAIEGPLTTGRDVILEIEVQGAQQVRERRDDARFVFLLPPSMAELGRRLTGRGTDSPDEIRSRLRRAEVELESIRLFDYAIFNEDLDRCVSELESVIAAERTGSVASARERHAIDGALARFHRGGAA